MIDAALVEKILNGPGISGLIGTRFYPLILPQNTKLPAATFQLIARQARHGHDDEADYQQIFQVDCWADTYPETKSLADNLRSLLDGYSGPVGSLDALIFLDNEKDEYIDAAKLYRVSMDFIIKT
jgi:uncharacterized protein DUF3168